MTKLAENWEITDMLFLCFYGRKLEVWNEKKIGRLLTITFSFAYIQLVELHPLEYATAILFHLDCSLEFYLPCTTWKL